MDEFFGSVLKSRHHGVDLGIGMKEDHRHNRKEDVLFDGVNELDLFVEISLAADHDSRKREMSRDLSQCFKMAEIMERDLTAAEKLPEMEVETESGLPDSKMIDRLTFWLPNFGDQPVLEGDIFYVRR